MKTTILILFSLLYFPHLFAAKPIIGVNDTLITTSEAMSEKTASVIHGLQSEFTEKVNKIIYELGKDDRIEIIRGSNGANFILYFFGYVISDADGDNELYFLQIDMELHDAVTKKIIAHEQHKAKYLTQGILSPQEIVPLLSVPLIEEAPLNIPAQTLAESVDQKTEIVSATISYRFRDTAKMDANGSNKGDVTVSDIESTYGPIGAEIKTNPLTKYKLVAEKGTFEETNSKEIFFSGDEYLDKQRKIKKTYKTFDCKKEDSSTEIFSLYLIEQNGENVDNKLIKKYEQEFECGCAWDIEVEGTSSIQGLSMGVRPYEISGYAKWENVSIEADPTVDCRPDLPKKVYGYNFLQIMESKKASIVIGFVDDDALFIDLLVKKNNYAAYDFSFNAFDNIAAELLDDYEMNIGFDNNCGLFPKGDPSLVCSYSKMMEKLKNMEPFQFDINTKIPYEATNKYSVHFTPKSKKLSQKTK